VGKKRDPVWAVCEIIPVMQDNLRKNIMVIGTVAIFIHPANPILPVFPAHSTLKCRRCDYLFAILVN